MTSDRWHRITEIFHAARIRRIEEREAFLVEACRDDPSLRPEVDALLAGHEVAGSFGDTPVFVQPVRLEPGAPFGQYWIEQLIGRGGMGEVYRARDTTLGRQVAVKVLPPTVLADPLCLERLEREARVLAALTHPNIGTIYGVEHVNGVYGLVLELVDGPTLADRIVGGPLSLNESLRLARQIVDALETAHERGIVHRDIKPSNIALTRDGVLKVLDFGLAKAVVGDTLKQAATDSPTAMTVTYEGTLIGTTAYMSPEQACGEPLDRRTDIWAFGCVLFEMLTGEAAFERETRSETIAALLERDPPWERLPASTPGCLRQLLQRCLEKDPKRRLRDIGDARFDLEQAASGPMRTVNVTIGRNTRVRLAALTAAVACVVAAAVIAFVYARRGPGNDDPTTRFSVMPEEGVALSVPALSPDGRRLAYVAAHNGVPMVWLRSFDTVDAQPLPGSEDARFPFWSPDGRSLGLVTAEDLSASLNLTVKIFDDVGSGRVRTLGGAPVDPGLGAMWCPDGRIVLGSLTQGLMAFTTNAGSAPRRLRGFDLAHGEGGLLYPTMLPDGRHFLYLSEPSSTIWVASLDSSEATRLLTADSQALYVPQGYLLFVRRQTLFAQRFDPDRLKLSGEPIAIADGVFTEQSYGADFTASSNGVLAYRTGTVHVPTRLTWVDRAGRRLGTIGPPGRYANIEISSDGGRVVMEALDVRTYTKDLWTMDTTRGVLTHVTFDSGNETFPIWSPDSRWIMFASDRNGGWQLYRRRADGDGDDERVATTAEAMVPQSWAPNGQSVVYLQRPVSLGVLQLNTGTLGLIDRAHFEGSGRLDGYGQISPDGHWLLYDSNESGQWDVYVRKFPSSDGSQWKISEHGAISPRWSHDGREIFYYSSVAASRGERPNRTDGQIVAVGFSPGPTPTIGSAKALFKASLLGGPVPAILWRMEYAVSNDGRFLLNEPLEDPYARAPIVVVTNWMTALKK
jgi:Tol biopolymer transport system component/tRNA A-37 threonylcarbamoyl transferase component Bud32